MTSFTPDNAQRFAAALARFDAENSRDPKSVLCDQVELPYEVAYARWLSNWVLRLNPEASEALQLAGHCQHLRRWEIPRKSYPATRAGYLQWRQVLKEFHALKASEILRESGYPDAIIQLVKDLNLKKHFPADPECRTLEDALCLVFLERQYTDLAAKTTEKKMITALQKCWTKMTPAAHALAMQLDLSPEGKRLLDQALKPRIPFQP